MPGRDNFAEEPRENRDRDKEEAPGGRGSQEEVAHIHFQVRKGPGARVCISVVQALKAGFNRQNPCLLAHRPLEVYIGAGSLCGGRTATPRTLNSRPFPGLEPRVFDIIKPTFVLGLIRDMVTFSLPLCWWVGGDNSLHRAVGSSHIWL